MSGSLLIWIVALPLVAVPGILLFHHRPNAREAVSIVTGVLLLLLVTSLWGEVSEGGRPALTLAEPLPGIQLALRVEPLGFLLALVASLLWVVTTVYAIGYMRGHHEKNQTRFYAFFAIAIASTMGAAFAANLVTLFVFYEALTLSTFPLVTHAGTDAARRGGRTYLGLLLATSIGFLLFAIVWTWQITGTTEFTPGGILAGRAGTVTLTVLYALFLFGIGKAALMPFHRWLPAAMVAPTPVSALLHAVAVVKVGVFCVLKVSVYIFGIDLLADTGASIPMLYVAAITILFASLVALHQDNLKRRLAYSTVGQLGYVVLGATLATTWGTIGSGMHIAMHAAGKITLFFCAGAIMVAAHKTEVSELDGIGRRMPWTLGAFTIGALSMIGVPPAAGFLSKWYLLLGGLTTEHYAILAVLFVSTLLNIAYYMPIVYAAFFRSPPPGSTPHGEAPWPMVAALMATACLTLVLFVYPEPVMVLLRALTEGG